MMGCELAMWPREEGPAESCSFGNMAFGNMAEDEDGARLAMLRLLLSISQIEIY